MEDLTTDSVTVDGDWVVVPRAFDDPDVVRMIDEVQAEYIVRYGSPDESVVGAHEFVLPDGLFLVGLLGGEPVATGAWRTHGDAGEAEIKRMYVAAPARRRGLGRLMLGEVERTAAAAGVRRLVLNTGLMQPEAIALYRGDGYTDSRPFGRYAGYTGAVFLGKDL